MSPRPSSHVSPRRRPLHERTPSQTNEVTPDRMGKRGEEIDYYSTTPYPTKPAQVLLPQPGIGQSYALQGAYGVSDLSLLSTETDRTATGHIDEHHHDISVGNTWDLSSSFGQSSQVWDNDPQSSQSSFPTPLLPSDDTNDEDDESLNVTYEDKTVSKFAIHEPTIGMQERDDIYANEGSDEANLLGDEDGEGVDDDEDVIGLPPLPRASIKPVLPGSSSPRSEPSENFPSSENFVTYDHSSSPNIVPIGAPSSPNFVSLGSSSPNVVVFESSSPAARRPTHRSKSSSSSSNSLGTVIHTFNNNNNATSWPGPLSDGVSSQPASFTSSPPEQLLREYKSASSLALSGGETNLSRSRTTSTGSGRSENEKQSVTDAASAMIQYPQIRVPSYASSYAESSTQAQVKRPVRTVSERSATRWNPTLSTVPAQSPVIVSSTTPDGPSDNAEGKQGLGLASVSKVSSTILPVEENDEHLDSLSNLPRSTLRHIPSSLVGAESRPGSSSSSINGFLNVLPNWVRLYYHSNGQLVQTSTLSFVESSRPSTAASRSTSPHRYISQAPATISRPRTRPHEEKEKAVQAPRPPRLISNHPSDPRSHWKPTEQTKQQQDEENVVTAENSARRPFAKASSPHLHPGKGHTNPRYTWTAPSLDSRLEPLLGRRNVQKYAFCLGFVCPLIWFIAAFLPLPPQPTTAFGDEEQVVARPGAEYLLEEYEKKRYQNARWWRNVNRVMIPVGIAIIAIIVVLAVIGTRVGF